MERKRKELEREGKYGEGIHANSFLLFFAARCTMMMQIVCFAVQLELI